MNASSILVFLVLVAFSANLIAARSSKKKSNSEKAVDDALKHRVKTKKIDALKQQDEADNYWTQCEPQYASPLGVCDAGYHLTRDPTHNNRYTWAKEVAGIWDGAHTFRCHDSPHKEVRYFCSKTYTKSYWQGTAPLCGSEDSQVSDCREAGYDGLRIWTSNLGDGSECNSMWGGTKVLCAKV